MDKQEPRKVRQDLSPQEKERLDRYGSLEFKSAGVKFSHNVHTEIFIPSREQH